MSKDLRRKEELQPLPIPPIDWIIFWIIILVLFVSFIVILSQLTGFCQMDVYNNGAWRHY